MARVTLTIVVDKKKNRVAFAEAGKDFVDILLSFLTLPLGTVIRLLGKQSAVGCVDRLYESVENMDVEYLETEACKTMLLQPRSEAEKLCEDLKINVDDLEPRRIYRCPTFECFTRTHKLFSSVSDARCKCGKTMDYWFEWRKKENKDIDNGNGIFVKGSNNRYIISDDLHVTSAFSMGATLSLLEKHGIKDAEALEKITVDITRDKILMLPKRLMLSTTPLTDTFLLEEDKLECGSEDQECDQMQGTKQIKLEDDSTAEPTSSIRVNVLYDKLNKKVLSAQGGEDFVDVLFSFLTFPLGCIVKLLERYSSVVCLDNLYKSVELLDGSVGMKSGECKNLLLAPKLYTHFGCSNQLLLRTEEKPSQLCRVHSCETCWNEGIVPTLNSTCKHNIDVVFITQVNPKLSNSGTECGGGYAKKSVRFMITDDMVVKPLSPASGIDAIKQSKIPFRCLVEKEVMLGEEEILTLLKRLMLSTTPLTDTFLLKLDTMGCGNVDQECDQSKVTTQIKSEDDSTSKSMSSIRVNILYDKVSKKLVFAQGGDDFVDVLFSFLTFPLGCIVKLLDRNSSVRCLDNLYKSVEIMDVASGIMSDECKNLLLSPKLYTHFGCSNHILGTEEKKPSLQPRVFTCIMCCIVTFEEHYCRYNGAVVEVLTEVNPKLSSSGTECGGGYAKKPFRFMITDDMVVTPHSPASEIDAIKLSKTPIHNLVEKEVVLQKAEVANLMKACLISRTALTNVFCSKKKKVLY